MRSWAVWTVNDCTHDSDVLWICDNCFSCTSYLEKCAIKISVVFLSPIIKNLTFFCNMVYLCQYLAIFSFIVDHHQALTCNLQWSTKIESLSYTHVTCFHNGQNVNRLYVTTCSSVAQWYATVYSMQKEGAACQQTCSDTPWCLQQSMSEVRTGA